MVKVKDADIEQNTAYQVSFNHPMVKVKVKSIYDVLKRA